MSRSAAHVGDADVQQLLGRQGVGDDADDFASGVEDGIRQHAHQPDASAAEHEPPAATDKLRPESGSGLAERGETPSVEPQKTQTRRSMR